MKTIKLRDWLEIIGIFSVVGSLIFVGLQMKQTKEISISQAYQARASIVVDWTVAQASNPMALSANRKAREGKMEEIMKNPLVREIYNSLISRARPTFRTTLVEIDKKLTE